MVKSPERAPRGPPGSPSAGRLDCCGQDSRRGLQCYLVLLASRPLPFPKVTTPRFCFGKPPLPTVTMGCPGKRGCPRSPGQGCVCHPGSGISTSDKDWATAPPSWGTRPFRPAASHHADPSAPVFPGSWLSSLPFSPGTYPRSFRELRYNGRWGGSPRSPRSTRPSLSSGGNLGLAGKARQRVQECPWSTGTSYPGSSCWPRRQEILVSLNGRAWEWPGVWSAGQTRDWRSTGAHSPPRRQAAGSKG